MKPKMIYTEEDYQRALERLDELMDAKPGSPDEEELDLLSHLVEQYEEEQFPIDLPDPVEAIKFRMEQQGLTRKDMRQYLGSQSKVSEVLNHKRPLSLSMIRSLHKGLGIPAEVLLQEYGGEIPEKQYDISNYPFTDMVRRGYFKDKSLSLNRAKDNAETLLTDLFSVFGDTKPQHVYCRYTDKEVDQNAICAWHARVLQLTQGETIEPYSPAHLTDEFLQGFVYLSNLTEGPKMVKEYLQKKGIHFIVLRHLPRTYLDGACFMNPAGNPVIALTLRYDRQDYFWFTLAHELGHLKLHAQDENKAFFDDTQKDENKIAHDFEKSADAFALELLIPSEKWDAIREAALMATTSEEINTLAKRISISPAIVAGRVRWETGNFSLFNDLLGSRTLRSQFFA